MAKETDQAFEHQYDGIQEYDNPLPGWWLYMFVLTAVFSVAYVPYYHFGPGQLPVEAYEEDMAAWWILHPPPELAPAEQLQAMAGDESLIAVGQPIFVTLCTPCHAPDGGGLVGPNLTDDYSLHGGSLPDIARVIFEGVPDKGMVSWKNQLKMEELYGVAAYVHSLRGTTPANPKAAQGDKIGGP